MAGEKIRILVIDDDVELARTVCDALESQGYEASAAGGGEQGLELGACREILTLQAFDVVRSAAWSLPPAGS